jgi:hypothetical protein
MNMDIEISNIRLEVPILFVTKFEEADSLQENSILQYNAAQAIVMLNIFKNDKKQSTKGSYVLKCLYFK